MRVSIRRWSVRLILSLVVPAASGCRDLAPSPAHNRDLGSEDAPLLPPRSSRHDPALKDGTAEWHPFRELSTEEEAGTDQPAEGGNEVEAEIRELIEEYNELVAGRDLEELLAYHIEQQQEAVKALFETRLAFADKLGEIKAALQNKLPDAKDRVADIFAGFAAAGNGTLVVESLTVVSDTEVAGALSSPGLGATCRFLVVDDEWYMELPRIPDIEQVRPMLEMAGAQLDALVQGLKSGQVPAEQALGQFATAMKAMFPAGPAHRVPGDD